MKFNTNKSLINYNPRPCADINLICFANAGAGAPTFRPWTATFGEDVDVWAAAYPGRDTLTGKDPVKTLAEVVEYYTADLSLFPDKGYVLYGHSFGALVAFALALELQSVGRAPAALCVGARHAPHLDAYESIDWRNQTKLVEQLKKVGGMPDAILNDKDMLEYFLPHISNDLMLNEQGDSLVGQKVECPIYAFSSLTDQLVRPTDVVEWSQYTDESFEHTSFIGGHFFISQKDNGFFDKLSEIIGKTMI
ncbi:MAG: hypothetical protein COA99_17450 [Moraxellaceae bacterium]|nr:MAG: hypothetical protein COA99_17450 [Moraxellaceae bacterium]